jgi:hypothetical protein
LLALPGGAVEKPVPELELRGLAPALFEALPGREGGRDVLWLTAKRASEKFEENRSRSRKPPPVALAEEFTARLALLVAILVARLVVAFALEL